MFRADRRSLVTLIIVIAVAKDFPAAEPVANLVNGKSSSPNTAYSAFRYSGMCDASAAVAVDDEHFLVADDEINTLRIYTMAQPGTEVAAFPWGRFLDLDADGKHLEADIEGATRIGDTYYWISSHGRNLNGKWRPNRHHLFAMTIAKTPTGFAATPVGTPYHRLALDLLTQPQLAGLGFTEAIGSPEDIDKALAPKDEGLNIEGLTAMADGGSLLIGFRNPIPQGRALLIPLLNPQEVVLREAKPIFGTPILLRLHVRFRGKEHALGIRSIEYSRQHRAYLIAAGLSEGSKVFALYAWSGNPVDRPQLLKATATVLQQDNFAPEALIVYPQQQIQLLSDDGTTKVPVISPTECKEDAFKDGKCEQKFLLDDQRKTFGSLLLEPL